MSDDIVSRLRELDTGLWATQPLELCVEAADEIERLREEARWFHELSDNYKKCLDIVYNKKAWWKR